MKRRGMTLIELLICMAITSMLMAAVCAAFNASAVAVRYHRAFVYCTQSARGGLSRMLSEIRQADAVQVEPDHAGVQVIRPVLNREAGEVYRQYSYDPASKRITLRIFMADGTSSPVYDVGADISACVFIPTAVQTGDASTTLSVAISITCTRPESSVTLTGAASPRRVAYNHAQ